MKTKIEFYKQKIEEFEALRQRAVRKDRIDLIIQAYHEELQKLEG